MFLRISFFFNIYFIIVDLHVITLLISFFNSASYETYYSCLHPDTTVAEQSSATAEQLACTKFSYTSLVMSHVLVLLFIIYDVKPLDFHSHS